MLWKPRYHCSCGCADGGNLHAAASLLSKYTDEHTESHENEWTDEQTDEQTITQFFCYPAIGQIFE